MELETVNRKHATMKRAEAAWMKSKGDDVKPMWDRYMAAFHDYRTTAEQYDAECLEQLNAEVARER